MGEEADAVNSQIFVEIEDVIAEMQHLYKQAELAFTGHMICCPTCKRQFKKKTKHQKFHSLGCKDRYWNMVDETRRERAQKFK